MPEYSTKRPPRGDYWEEDTSETAKTIVEPEDDSWTGLYDRHGSELHRARPAMGFDLSQRRKLPPRKTNRK